MFNIMIQGPYKNLIYYIKSYYYLKKKTKPDFFVDHVWTQYVEYWKGTDVMEASERAKKNRASALGSGTKHTTGSISIAEHQARMAQKFGPHIDFLDVFVSTHTKASAPNELP